MTKPIRILTALAVCCAAATAGAIEVDLKYEKYGEEDSDSFHPQGYFRLKASAKVPAGDWKLPKFTAKHPLYALQEFGDAKRLFALDRAKPNDSFYNRLYFDANGNGDLTDDPVIKPPSAEEGEGVNIRTNNAEFPPVDTTLKVGGKDLPYTFRVVVYLHMSSEEDLTEKNLEEGIGFYFLTSCCYSGGFELAGQKYKFILNDSNANGRFGDVAAVKIEPGGDPGDALYANGDRFYIIDGDRFQYRDSCSMGNLLHLKDGTYRVAIDAAAKKMSLTPVSEGLVTVKLPMPVDRLCLSSEDGRHGVMTFKAGDRLRIPAGSYRLIDYQVTRKEDVGDVWLIQAQGTRETPYVKVDEGGTFPLGEPYSAMASVPEQVYRSFREGQDLRSVPLYFRIEGCAHEVVDDLMRISGKKTKIPMSGDYRPKEPTYKIAKANGELIAEGSFRYG
jgi:hypothetical protein